MAIPLFLLFVLIPVVEIAVFIQLGGQIGLWNTIGLIILTAFIGTWMLRAQGMRTLARAQESLSRNVIPTGELFDGICLLIAGVLLLTPGFVTDAVGFLLFVPPFRRFLGNRILNTLAVRGGVWINGEEVSGTHRHPNEGDTIEGEYQEIHPANDPGKPPLPGKKDDKKNRPE